MARKDNFISISAFWFLEITTRGDNWQASPLYDGCRTKGLSGDPNPRSGKCPAPS